MKVNSLLGDIPTATNQAARRISVHADFFVLVSKSNLNIISIRMLKEI